MVMQPRGTQKLPKTVLWTVRGPRWSFLLSGPSNMCPTELATVAVERAWGNEAGESWKGQELAGTLKVDHPGEATMGIALDVGHDQMNSREDHIIVPGFLALANAGFHADAERLRLEWDRASDESKLIALVKLLGED